MTYYKQPRAPRPQLKNRSLNSRLRFYALGHDFMLLPKVIFIVVL